MTQNGGNKSSLPLNTAQNSSKKLDDYIDKEKALETLITLPKCFTTPNVQASDLPQLFSSTTLHTTGAREI